MRTILFFRHVIQKKPLWRGYVTERNFRPLPSKQAALSTVVYTAGFTPK